MLTLKIQGIAPSFSQNEKKSVNHKNKLTKTTNTLPHQPSPSPNKQNPTKRPTKHKTWRNILQSNLEQKCWFIRNKKSSVNLYFFVLVSFVQDFFWHIRITENKVLLLVMSRCNKRLSSWNLIKPFCTFIQNIWLIWFEQHKSNWFQ